MAFSEYRRLPGAGRKASLLARMYCRLYVGNDHLLSVESSGWIEKYRRYYFADIQALVISKTNRALIWNFVFAAFTVGPLGLALTREGGISSEAGIAWALGAVLPFILLLANLLRGPTCRATITTSISHELLPSLNRVRAAQKAANMLKPLIEQTQGVLDGPELAARLDELASTASPRIIPGRGMAGTHYLRHAGYSGALHRWTFGVALIAGVLGLCDIFVNTPALAVSAAVLMGIVLGLGIMSVVRQHESNTRSGLRAMTWGAIGWVALYFLGCYILLIVTTITLNDPKLANDYWRLLTQAAKVTPLLYRAVDAVAAAGLALGAGGMIMAFSARNSLAQEARPDGSV